MNIKKDIRFLLEVYHQQGLLEALKTLSSGIRYSGTSRLILVALEQPKLIQKALDASIGHRFYFATAEELLELKKYPQYEIANIDIERVKKNIAKCMIQKDGEKITGYAWVWTSNLSYIQDGFYFNLPHNAIYNYKALTLPEYRGLGFQGLRHLKLLELLKSEGKTRLFGFVDHFNRKSLHGVHKSGYRPVGELRIKKNKNSVSVNLQVNKDFWVGEPVKSDM